MTSPGASRRAAGATVAAAIPPGVTIRPARPEDLPACAAVWREAINDYLGRLNLPLVPDELAGIGRLHTHVHRTDPEGFLVATRVAGSASAERVVGFASALVRDRVWFLSMLFVRPSEQGRGLGRALLSRALPESTDGIRATATDSAQPISNALYSSFGIVPRMPLLSLIGRPGRNAEIERLPPGVVALPFDELVADGRDGQGHRRLVDEVDGIDAAVVGFGHPEDHRFLRGEGRRGFLYRGPEGSIVGYGYASEVGRLGPVAVRDETLLGPILGHLLTAIEPRGASAAWVPGEADRAIVALLRAGLRIDGFPVLLCWSAPFADFRRYLPISPGLL